MPAFFHRLIWGVLLLTANSASALVSPAGVSLLPKVQIPTDNFTIVGLRLNLLWGRQHSVYGLDLGLGVSETVVDFAGIGISGIANLTHGMTHVIGLQAAGIGNANSNKTHVFGAQIAGIFNSNSTDATIVGLQAAAIANLGDHAKIYGVQVGLYNRAAAVYGVQIGLINVTDSLHGVQIGLANANFAGPFTALPFLNVGM